MFPTRRFRRSPAMQQSSPSMSTVLLRRRPWVIFVDVDLFCHLSIYLLVSYWYLYVSVGIYWHLSVSMGWPSYPQMFIFSNEDSQQFLEFVGGPVAWWRLVKHHMGRPNQDCRNLFVGSCWLFAKIDQNSLSSSWIILILDISRYISICLKSIAVGPSASGYAGRPVPWQYQRGKFGWHLVVHSQRGPRWV